MKKINSIFVQVSSILSINDYEENCNPQSKNIEIGMFLYKHLIVSKKRRSHFENYMKNVVPCYNIMAASLKVRMIYVTS